MEKVGARVNATAPRGLHAGEGMEASMLQGQPDPNVSPSGKATLLRLYRDGHGEVQARRASQRSAWVALFYLAFGVLWIVTTDFLVVEYFPSYQETLQNVKGILYVALSTLIVYALSKRAVLGMQVNMENNRLRSMDNFAQVILSSIGEAVLVIDPSDRSIVWCNSATERLFGYMQSEIIGESTKIIHTDYDSYLEFGNSSETVLERGNIYHSQYEMLHKNGNKLIVEITVNTLDNESGWENGVISILHDVTEKVKAKSNLEKSEYHYRLLAENTLDMIWKIDINMTFTYLNPAVENISGYSPEECLGTKLSRYFQQEEYDRVSGIINNLLASDPEHGGIIADTEVVHKNGSLVPVEFRAKALFEDGVPIGLQGTARDITERKKAMDSLKDSEKKYRLTMDNLSELVYRADPDTMTPTYVSRAVEEIYGYTVQEWMSDPQLWLKTLYEQDKEKVLSEFHSALDTGRSAQIEYRVVCRNGNIRWVVDKFTPEIDDQGGVAAIIGVMDDITERKNQENRLRHQAYHDPLVKSPFLGPPMGRDSRQFEGGPPGRGYP